MKSAKLFRRTPSMIALPMLLLVASPAQADDKSPAPFDAAVAWSSFEKLLHEQYGYFDRAGIDGDAILSAFAARAKAARSDKEFVDTLQLVSYNFADPHFVVGPFDPEDWTTIPTSSTCLAPMTALPSGSEKRDLVVMRSPKESDRA